MKSNNKYRMTGLIMLVIAVLLLGFGTLGCDEVDKATSSVMSIAKSPEGTVWSGITRLGTMIKNVLKVKVWYYWFPVIGLFFLILGSQIRRVAIVFAYAHLFWIFRWKSWLVLGCVILSYSPFKFFLVSWMKTARESYSKLMDSKFEKGLPGWTVRQLIFGTIGCAIAVGYINGLVNNPKADPKLVLLFWGVGLLGFDIFAKFVAKVLTPEYQKKFGNDRLPFMLKLVREMWSQLRHGHGFDPNLKTCRKCRKQYNDTDVVCNHCGYPNPNAPWDCTAVIGKDSKGKNRICGEKDIPGNKKRCKKGHLKPPILVVKCSCGNWNNSTNAVCEKCGKALTGIAPIVPPGATGGGGESSENGEIICPNCMKRNPPGFVECYHCETPFGDPPDDDDYVSSAVTRIPRNKRMM